MMKKIIISVLLLALCTAFSACADNDLPTETTSSVTEKFFDENAPDLPSSDEVDLKGDFTILVSGNSSRNDFESDDGEGTPVEVAIFRRNEAVKEKYGVEIISEDVTKFGSTTGAQSGPGFQKLYNDYMSATALYDAAMVGTYDVATLAYNGLLRDLNNTPYINLSKAYWDQKANQDLAVNGKMYYTTGDIGVTDNIMTHAILFNKGMIEDYDLESPYELVRTGKWTLEKVSELVKKVGEDANNDGIYDDSDIYGLLTWNDPMIAILASSGEKIASISDKGLIELTFYNERVVNLYDDYENLVFDMGHVYNYQYDNVTGKATASSSWDTRRDSVFSEGRALFYMNLLEVVERHRDSDTDFGILPYPKFDEAQAEYGHAVSAYHTNFLCIPQMAKDHTRSGIIVEEFAYQGKKLLTPAYYDQTLIGRSVRDEESIDMLDIIFSTRVFDVGQYYNIGTYKDQLAKLFITRTPLASLYETYRSAAEQKINSINGIMQYLQ